MHQHCVVVFCPSRMAHRRRIPRPEPLTCTCYVVLHVNGPGVSDDGGTRVGTERRLRR